jgi:hypothetical protein
MLQHSTTAAVALREVRQGGEAQPERSSRVPQPITSDKPQAYHIFTEEIIATFIDDRVNTRL